MRVGEAAFATGLVGGADQREHGAAVARAELGLRDRERAIELRAGVRRIAPQLREVPGRESERDARVGRHRGAARRGVEDRGELVGAGDALGVVGQRRQQVRAGLDLLDRVAHLDRGRHRLAPARFRTGAITGGGLHGSERAERVREEPLVSRRPRLDERGSHDRHRLVVLADRVVRNDRDREARVDVGRRVARHRRRRARLEHQELAVRARGELGQIDQRGGGPIEDAPIADDERLDRGVRGRECRVETAALPVVQLGLLVAHARVAASLHHAGLPAPRPAIEQQARAHEPRVLRGLERVLEREPPLAVPRVERAIGDAAARIRVAPAHDRRDRRDRRDRDRADHEADASALALDRRELGEQRRHRRPACVRIGREAASHRAPEPRGHVAIVPGLRDLAGRHARRELHHAGTLERPLTVERLVERDAERELVAARVGAAAELLGGHVRGRAHHRAGARQILRQRRLATGDGGIGRRGTRDRRAGRRDQPEVGDAHAAVLREQHVVGLEVAVNEAERVRGHEPATGLHERVDDRVDRPRRELEPAAQRAALRELHRDVDLIAERADLVDLDHVAVIDLRHRLRLAEQPRPRLTRAGAGAQQLDRDLAIEVRIVRGVDDAHAARAQLAEDDEPADRVAARELGASAARRGRLRRARGRVVERRVVGCDRPHATSVVHEIVLFPTTVVGSMPQPDWLIDRAGLAKRFPPRVRARELWRVSPEHLAQAQDDATLVAIRMQEEAGLDIVSDGEIRRESYSNRFATALDGVDLDNPGSALDRSGHPNPVPRIVGAIRRRHAVEVDDVRFLRRHTDRRIKITVPGPFTMSQQAQNDHYATVDEAALDYAAAVNAEIKDLFAAGADIVQIDEPYLQARPDDARRYGLAAVSRALAGVTGTTAVHICFGYAAIIHERPTGYSFLRELAAAPCAQISVETAQSKLDCSVLAELGDKQIMVGCLDLADPAVETPEVVAARVRRALAFVPPERVILAPDCGMKYLPRHVAEGKLRAMVEAARILRRG